MPLAHDSVDMNGAARPMPTGDGMLGSPRTSGIGPVDSPEPEGYPSSRKKYRLGSIGTIFASGSAMFSDGYSNAAMGPVNTILGIVYKGTLAGRNKELLSAMGMILGQLSFGYVSDKLGRKFAMFICTAFILVFTFLCACAAGSPQTTINCLIAFRFLVGIGLGGEYPSGSVTAAEATENHNVNKKWQQRLFVWSTNTMLDLAFAIAWFVSLVLLWIFGDSHRGLMIVWRGVFGLGILPPLILLVARFFMDEPEAYKKNAIHRTAIPYWLILKRYWLRLLAVSVTWFIYDWITYPFGIYSGVITSHASPNATLHQTLGWGCLVNFFYVPGTLLGSLIVDYLGPKHTMVFGLVMQAIFGFALSGAYNKLVYEAKSIAGFAVMYGLFLSFGEVGPGNNLGLLASKAIGPTAARGQLYGIAAAIGKVGAFIGTYTFEPINADLAKKSKFLGDTGIFWIGSSLALFSALVTLLFIPHVSTDAMKEEDLRFREYLTDNGFDVSLMGEAGSAKDTGFETDHAVLTHEKA